MATLTQPHWEALTPQTQDAFRLTTHLPLKDDFYLAGGTGLALHLGHRFSVDLDFFSPDAGAVGPEARDALRQTFDDSSLAITHDTDGTFVATWRGVGISFFRLPLYPLVEPTVDVEGIHLASLEEIGAMKLAAAIDRSTRKDMVDLYFILRRTPIERIFQVAAVKYARVRTFAISAVRGLAYFEDAERLPMPRMIDPTPWPKMKKFLEQQAVEAGRQQLEMLWK